MKIIRGAIILFISNLKYKFQRPKNLLISVLLFSVYLISIIQLSSNNNVLHILFEHNNLLSANFAVLIFLIILTIYFYHVYYSLISIKNSALFLLPQFLITNNEKYLKEIFISVLVYRYLNFTISILILFLIISIFSSIKYNLTIILTFYITIPVITFYLPYKTSSKRYLLIPISIIFTSVFLFLAYNLLRPQDWFMPRLILSLFLPEFQNSKTVLNDLFKMIIFVISIFLLTLIPLKPDKPNLLNTLNRKKSISKRFSIKLINYRINIYRKIYYLYKIISNSRNKLLQGVSFFFMSFLYNFKLISKVILESIFIFIILVLTDIWLKTQLSLGILIIPVGYVSYKFAYFFLLPIIHTVYLLVNKNNNIVRILLLSFLINNYVLSCLLSICFITLSPLFNLKTLSSHSSLLFLILFFLTTLSVSWGTFLNKNLKTSSFSNSSNIEDSFSFIGYIWICVVPTLILKKLYELFSTSIFILQLIITVIIIKITESSIKNKIFIR